MPFFKDQQNHVYAYEDGVDPKYVKPGLTEVTAEEAEALRIANLPPPVPVVLTCTPWQMRKALNQMGLRASVEAYVAGADQTTKDGWEFATSFVENDAFVTAAQAALGMTDQQRKELFQLAVTL